ncbi:kelch repeat-containing protein [Steroidobacter agaridevorans]|uniref:kelch repeat-containing protein n=1 Tax=Steroidobacter agaridevorans TaxID=2695856 RepID=UPI00137B91C3|nr:kelch repeat-containing protein [Steroidobacter agaridevorans]
MNFRRMLAALVAASSLLVGACGGGGGGGGSPNPSPQSPSPPNPSPPQPAPITYTASGGVAEKGPLITGSTVTIQELDSSLSPTGKQYSYQVTSDLGAFSPTSAFTSQYLGINATGYYFDEVQGVVSSGPVTLNGYSELSIDTTVNVNILTTLAYQRIKKLIVDNQMTFAAARSQAEHEVLTAFGIPAGSYEPFGTLDLRGSSDGDRILAAISSVFVNGNQAGELSALISNFQTDLGANGRLTDLTTIAALATAGRDLNTAAVAANLNQRYAQLGVDFQPSDIAAWVDQDGDGIVGNFEYHIADAGPSSIFSIPAEVVDQIAGLSVSSTAGEFTINGTPVTTAVTVNSGDALTVSPGPGPFPDGVQTVYLTSGATKLARVSFVSGLLAITIAPSTTGDIPKGLTQQFTAMGTFSDGRQIDLTGSASWTSSAHSVATISPTGLAQTLGVGSTSIVAESGVISGSATLNVTAAVPITLALSPNPLRTGVGIGLKPTLNATYSDGTTVNVTSLATWASGAPSVATIDPHSGVIDGVSLGTTTIEATVDSLTETVPLAIVTNEWTVAGTLAGGRSGHAATLLPSGAVLATGNSNAYAGAPQTSAEIYNPLTRTWSPAANMPSRHGYHTATLLPDGRVLVAGGELDLMSFTNTVDLYDPVQNSWTAAPPMSEARACHTATVLANGKVLVAGGMNPTTLASAALYDPVNNTWSSAGTMATARCQHSATLLPNGTVLVVGGWHASGGGRALTATAEIYDPATGAWSAAASLSDAVTAHTATLLPNGTVLVAGGDVSNGRTSAASIYDPVSNTWSPTGSTSWARSDSSATLLPNGTVLLVGGLGTAGLLSAVEIYDPATGTWSARPSLHTARSRHQATLLTDGAVLITGGSGGTPLSSSELYW